MSKRSNTIIKKLKTKEELSIFLAQRLHNGDFTERIINIKNISFDFDVIIPLNYNGGLAVNPSNYINNCKYNFINCNFYKEVLIQNSKHELIFEHSNFNSNMKLNSRDRNLTFINSHISDIDVSESKFGDTKGNSGKLRLKSSDIYKSNFKNATFLSLVDFYYSTFHNNTIFYKTDFMNIVVMSATKFKQNLLFTYTLLNDKVIMRSTIFEKGFDFSLSIIKGQLAIFDLHHSYKLYTSTDGLKEEREYERAVSYDGIIPTQNKLETYRLLKVEFESQKNVPEYLNFKLHEKETFKKILNKQKLTWKNSFDQITLWLNRVSNKYGTSYSRAFLFTVIVGWLFFYLSLIATDTYEFTFKISEWEFGEGLSYFTQFLVPTHKFNYMGNEVQLTPGYYIFDFFGRLFTGYGIYQFIQAFRKFK